MGHAYPAPIVVAQATDSGSGSPVTFDLPLGGVVLDDVFILHVLWFWSSGVSAEVTVTGSSGWTRRDRHTNASGTEWRQLEEWTAFYDGSMTDVTFTLGTASTQAAAAFDVIDNHRQEEIASPQLSQYANPNHSAVDFRYYTGGTLSPHEAVRQTVFAVLAGSNADAGDLGPVDGPPGDGYTGFHGLDVGDIKLYVAYKRTGFVQSDPENLSFGLGGWTFQTPGGGWAWAAVGTPENDEDMNGTAPSEAHFFTPISMVNTWHYHEYFVDVEEDVPYWGILCTPSDS